MNYIFTTALIAIGIADTLANRAGPGGISLVLREWLSDERRPAWVQAGSSCVFCFAFYGALLGAVLHKPRRGPFGWRLLLRTWLAGFGLAVLGFLYLERR